VKTLRWLPVSAMMLVSVVSYIDRTTLAILAPTILRETHLSNEQYGFIVSAFSLAYMLGNPVWGMILDRIGTKPGMLFSVTAWSLASVSHAFAGNLAGFAAARAVLGFGEGATFPGSMRTATETLPAEQRSRGIALSYSGGSLGAIITPLIVTPVALAFGWRAAFWFTGGIGVVWLVIWLLIPRPEPVGRIVSARTAFPWFDAPVWAFIAAYALGALPLGVVLNGASLYLSGALHKTQAQIGAVLWIPPLGWEVGYFFWGWATDRYLGSGANVPGMQKVFVGLAAASMTLALVPRIQSFALTMIEMFFLMFLAAGFIIGSLAYANHYYRRRHAGLIAGLGAGSWSLVVAIVMPGIGRLFDLRMYQTAFALASLGPAFGVLCWWGLRKTSSSRPWEAGEPASHNAD
jgi:ACS family hexuronate transporter-like MFS transporter